MNKVLYYIVSLLFFLVTLSYPAYCQDEKMPEKRFFVSFGVSYHPMTRINYFSGELLSGAHNGFGISWTNSHALSSAIPFYIEYGLTAQYSFGNECRSEIKDLEKRRETIIHNGEYKFLAVKCPIGLMYRFHIPGSHMYISPYAGIDLIAYMKADYEGEAVFEKTGNRFDAYTESLLSDNEYLGYALNRYNIDWHVGGKLSISHVYAGIGYERPMMGLFKRQSDKMIYFSQFNISMGYVF